MLLMGDPSTAKSQFLKFAAKTVSLAHCYCVLFVHVFGVVTPKLQETLCACFSGHMPRFQNDCRTCCLPFATHQPSGKHTRKVLKLSHRRPKCMGKSVSRATDMILWWQKPSRLKTASHHRELVCTKLAEYLLPAYQGLLRCVMGFVGSHFSVHLRQGIQCSWADSHCGQRQQWRILPRGMP